MHGEKSTMWLNKFKVAIAEENAMFIGELLKEVPTFKSTIKATEALYLIKEADKLMQRLQAENLDMKAKLKKHIEFMKSTHNDNPSNLDIKQ